MADGGASTVLYVRTADVARDPQNPRRATAEETLDVSDLLPLIREQGIVTPLDVGPMDVLGNYTLRDGERRLIVAEKLDLTAVPVLVGPPLTPAEVLARQLATYARAPLPPLQEARALQRMAALLSATPAQVADRLGLSLPHVRRRLELLQLVPEAQALLQPTATGQPGIGLGLAQAIAALRTGQEAVAARCRALLAAMPDRAPLRLADVAEAIEEQRRRLPGAPWKLDDATLPGGACTTCPKRTAAQAQLFEETVEGADECLDRGCYGAKEAAWRERRDDAVAEQQVGPGKAKAGRTAKGDAFKPPAPTPPRREPTADDPAIDDDTEEPLPRQPGQPLPRAKPKGSAADDAKVERQAEEAARERALAKICSAMAKRKPDESFWRLLASLVIRDACATWPGLALAALGRRGISGGPSDEQATRRLLDQVRGASEGECRGLIVELLAAADETGVEDDVFTLACRAAKVDYPALLAEELEKARAAKPVERPRGKAAHPPPQPPEGAKGVPPCTCKPGRGPHAGKCPVLLARKAPPEPVAKGEPSACPLTEAHVAALLVELRITDAHPGAVSPANVWASARGLLTLVTDLHPAEVARTNVLSRKGFADAGEHAVDCAAAFLAKGEVVRTIAAGRGGWRLTLSAAILRNLESDCMIPLPDPVKVFNPPRRCAVCGCTDSAACTDGAGECTWERRGADDVCSVCTRCCAKALGICRSKQAPTAVEKALVNKAGGEAFDKPRAKATIAFLEKAGELGRATDGKLLAAQPQP